MHRRLLSAAAISALLLGLAACGEPTDGPVTTPPPSISVSGPSDGGGDAEPSDGGGETVEPTAGAPSIPPPDPADFAGMDEHTAEGAEQAFRYYIALLYWGYQTGSSDKVESLQGPTCSECSELVNEIDQIQQEGAYWRQTVISEQGSSSTAESENYDIEVGLIYIISEREDSTTNTDKHPPVEEQAFTARGGMYWTEGGWVVGGVDIAETIHDL